jgi:D-aminoacyl-tRNA deacylase
MRVVAQRVTSASVEVEGCVVGEIAGGLLLFVGVGRDDVGSATRADALADKVANLRIFADAEGRSNLSLLDTRGSALVISQFTLYADTRRGRRPSFTEAADPIPAEALVERFRSALERLGVPTAGGRFGAHMTVSLVNDGPYTVVLDSEALSGPRAGRRPPAGSGADPAKTAHSTAADQPKGD